MSPLGGFSSALPCLGVSSASPFDAVAQGTSERLGDFSSSASPVDAVAQGASERLGDFSSASPCLGDFSSSASPFDAVAHESPKFGNDPVVDGNEASEACEFACEFAPHVSFVESPQYCSSEQDSAEFSKHWKIRGAAAT